MITPGANLRITMPDIRLSSIIASMSMYCETIFIINKICIALLLTFC